MLSGNPFGADELFDPAVVDQSWISALGGVTDMPITATPTAAEARYR